VRVPLAERGYDVWIGPGLIQSAGARLAEAVRGRDVALISDSNVGGLYSHAVRDSLQSAGFRVEILEVAAGEKSKCLAAAERLCEEMADLGFRRDAVVIGLGGGVIGDLAGFVAAIYQRGLAFVQMPTTILSFVDSAVGGKTGVNLRRGKNLVGAFHQPQLVIGDTHTLASLGEREAYEGFAEIIKHGVIADPDLVKMSRPPLDPETLPQLLARNVAIKAAVVSSDEFETTGLRALLNFGHTIGHAIESAAGYGQYLHGEAISLGLRAAGWLSMENAGFPATDHAALLEALDAFGLPLVLPHSIGMHALLDAMGRDKKAVSSGVRFVLASRLGCVALHDPLPQSQIEAAIEHLRHAP